jgi:very-short-patch-repair endonuclease
MKIACKKHGEFEQRPDNHLRGDGCPSCNNSVGENLVENYLIRNNLSFKKEKTFKDCKNKEVLSFDFYLENLNTIIEFDGIQHYEPIEYFGGLENFTYRKLNDEIKNEYCKNNNIRLIRIPFYDINRIEEILKRELTM